MDSETEDTPVKENNPLSLANYIKLEENDDELTEIDAPVHEEDHKSSSSESSSCETSSVFESLINPSGAWGTHRFEKYPWSDYCRPCVRLEEYDDLSLDEDEESGLLTDSIIGSCLSYLERSPYNLKYVLCKCVLSHKKLTDISALTYYHYIQYLDLSWNNITTLEPLGQLPFLQHLNASHNNIELLLNFKAPFYLSFVNFSYNSIEDIPDLTEFWSINNLNISNNRIIKISGLQNLRYLNELNLSYNKITTLENLSKLRIQFLILHHNCINDANVNTMSLKDLSYLRSVDLSDNYLSSLRMFEHAENLENINLSANKVDTLLELTYLQNLRYLSKLNLSGNPVAEEHFYVSACLRSIKNVMILNGKEITAEQRIEIKSHFEIHPKLKAGESHIELILLQQLNNPAIGAHIVPYDHPPPLVIILVGPPGSKKETMVQTICANIKNCVLGVSHTTRPKEDVEIDGKDYHFVSNEVFTDLTRRGRFMSVTEFNGHSYGITHKELQKCEKGILIFQCDLNAALSFKCMGLNPQLVLAMPRHDTTHLSFLKMKYHFDELEQGICRVRNSSAYIRPSMVGLDSVTSYNRAIIEDIIKKAVDVIEYEELLHANTIYTRNTAHTVTPVLLSEDENIIEASDRGNSSQDALLCSILKRENCAKEGTRVSFYKSPCPEYSVTSTKLESEESFLSTYSSLDISSKASSEVDYTNVSSQVPVDNICKSVSEQVSTAERYSKNDLGPLLSELSSQQVYRQSADETIYIRPTEIFNLIRDEKLSLFFQNIIEYRAILLDLHWSNPGLFREIIFTDEEEASLEKVKALIKFTVKNYKSMKRDISMKDDPSYKRIVPLRFDNLDLQQSPQCGINWCEERCSCEHCEKPKGSHQGV